MSFSYPQNHESHNYNVDEKRLDTKEFIWHDPTEMKGKHEHN